MRYVLTVDFEDPEDVDAILGFIRFHASRLKCLEKDVFVKLAAEWKRSQFKIPEEDMKMAVDLLKKTTRPKKENKLGS